MDEGRESPATAPTRVTNRVKAKLMGLALMNFVGPDVVRDAVRELGSGIERDPSAAILVDAAVIAAPAPVPPAPAATGGNGNR